MGFRGREPMLGLLKGWWVTEILVGEQVNDEPRNLSLAVFVCSVSLTVEWNKEPGWEEDPLAAFFNPQEEQTWGNQN